MKTQTIIGLIAVIAVIYCLWLSFGMNPDIVIWNVDEYKFGFNISSHIIEKIVAVGLLGTYGYLATAKEPTD